MPGDTVVKRTIYRDMTALCEVGVPIVALPGEGYELLEGYYLRPLVFTPDEGCALSLAAQMLLSQASGCVATSADQALGKLAAVLPPEARQRVDVLVKMIQFVLPSTRFNLDDPRLILFQQAIGVDALATEPGRRSRGARTAFPPRGAAR